MANRKVVSAVFLLPVLTVGCASKQVVMESPLALELGNPATQEITKSDNKFGYRAVNHFVFLDQESASRYLAESKQKCDIGQMTMRFCPNHFKEQPDVCSGAMQSIFLSDRKIDALKGVVMTMEKFDSGACCVVEGFALSLKSCKL